jgi:hypothetical protein
MQFEDWQTAPDPKVIRKEKQKARELRKSQWWKNRRALQQLLLL